MASYNPAGAEISDSTEKGRDKEPSFADLEQLQNSLSDLYYQNYLLTDKGTKLLAKSELKDYLPSQETEYFYLATSVDICEDDQDEDEEGSQDEEDEEDSQDEEEDEDDCEDENESGAWMMFISLDLLDNMWQKLCDLYYSSELPHVTHIVASTIRRNPRATSDHKGTILVYCEPWHDEELIRRVGYNLIIKMNFFSERKFMYYKPVFMMGQGTEATGRKINSFYRISVPETIVEAYSWKHQLKDILKDQSKFDSWIGRQTLYKRNIIDYEKGIAPWVVCEQSWKHGQDVRLLDQ